MSQSKFILKKYVTFEENHYWTCKSCQHKSNGRRNRMIAHLTGIQRHGIRTCPKISLEKSEEIKRELGLGSHSTDADGQQPQQAREKDDIGQEKGNKKRKSVSGSGGPSGSDPREAEMSPLSVSNSFSALGESISVSDGSMWSLENLEKSVGTIGPRLDNPEQNPSFPVPDLVSFPLETSDAFRTVLPDARADGPNMNNDPIPPPLPVDPVSDQHMHPLQDEVGNGTCTSPLGNAYGVEMANAIVLGEECQPPCPLEELQLPSLAELQFVSIKKLKHLKISLGELEKEIIAETEEGDQMLVTKRNNDRDRWVGYAKNFKCDVNDLEVEIMKAKSCDEMIRLLSRIDDLTTKKDRLIEMGTALLHPVPKDILSWNPTYMSCKSQLVNQMPLGQFC